MENVDYRNIKTENEKLIQDDEKNQSPICLGLPEKITWTNTIRCNLFCKRCPINRTLTKNHSDLPLDRLEKLAETFFPALKTLNLTRRGELFVDPNLQGILDLCRQYGVKADINTNGTLMTEEWIERNIDLLTDVKISIDGTKKSVFEKIRKGAKFSPVINNVRNLVRIRDENNLEKDICISFEFTIMRQNVEQLPDLIKLADDVGVDCVKGYHMFVFRPGFEEDSMLKNKDLYNKIFYKCKGMENRYDVDLHLARPFLKEGDRPLFDDRRCPRLWRRFWIDVNGDILPCLH
ncbi:MAG: radical SAM protein, partial [Thermoplasmata archaeon]